jgi:DNA-binding NarL/FixJ family response regulator
MKRITVVLAEDHTVVRQGLRALLQTENDIEVVGEAATGREAVELALKLRPAVIVMDIAMPELNGLEATRQILKANPGAKILILSAHSEEACVKQVTALGVAGYLVKQTSAHVLARAVREVQRGKTFFSPTIVGQLRQHRPEPPKRAGVPKTKAGRLSSRETEVLRLIAEGHPNKRVAVELRISAKTVEKHRHHVMEKLHIHDTAGLTRYAIAAGVIASDVQLTIV